jgi:hypothetical protein
MKSSVVWMVVACAGVALAGEKKIARTAVPQPVLAALAKHFPSAKQLGFAREEEKGKVIFEAQLQDGSRRLDVDVTPDGKLAAVEETIAPDAAPEAVRKGVAASKYAKATVMKAEKVQSYEDDKVASTAYEFVVRAKHQKVEIVLDEAGKIVKEEPLGND